MSRITGFQADGAAVCGVCGVCGFGYRPNRRIVTFVMKLLVTRDVQLERRSPTP
jgi:hypothetical protein